MPDFWFKRTDGKKVTQVDRGLPVPGHLRVRRRSRPPRQILEMMVSRFLTVTGEIEVRRHGAGERGGITPVRGADRGVAGPGRGGQRRRPRQGRPGRLQPGLHGNFPTATACSSTSTLNYWLELARQADQGVQGHDRRPSSTTRRTRTTRTATAGLTADADQQPGQGGAAGRDGPAGRARGSTSWRSTRRATRRSPTTDAEHEAQQCRGAAENGVPSVTDQG